MLKYQLKKFSNLKIRILDDSFNTVCSEKKWLISMQKTLNCNSRCDLNILWKNVSQQSCRYLFKDSKNEIHFSDFVESHLQRLLKDKICKFLPKYAIFSKTEAYYEKWIIGHGTRDNDRLSKTGSLSHVGGQDHTVNLIWKSAYTGFQQLILAPVGPKAVIFVTGRENELFWNSISDSFWRIYIKCLIPNDR